MLFKILSSPIKSQRCVGNAAFTLIELSIVLVIIGLIIGGILTGQDLINAAAARAQISQIEKFKTAMLTFRGKYGYLPGDIPNPYATNFGFSARGVYRGQGDGNGIIEGSDGNSASAVDIGDVIAGETGLAWMDLSAANLIEGSFSSASATAGVPSAIPSSAVGTYLPQAKMGKSNYLYIWAGGWPACANNTLAAALLASDGFNYIGLSEVTGISVTIGYPTANVSLSVQDAYNIDKKTDDGYPQSGAVTAQYPSTVATVTCWAAASGLAGAYNVATGAPTTTATPWASTNCYDNNNITGPQQYSIYKNATSPNCALSFRIQ